MGEAAAKRRVAEELGVKKEDSVADVDGERVEVVHPEVVAEALDEGPEGSTLGVLSTVLGAAEPLAVVDELEDPPVEVPVPELLGLARVEKVEVEDKEGACVDVGESEEVEVPVLVDDSEREAVEDWEGLAVEVRERVDVGDEVRVSVREEEGVKVVEGHRDTVEDWDNEGRGENERVVSDDRVVSPLVG